MSKARFAYLVRFKESGNSYVLAKTEHAEELFFGAIQTLTGLAPDEAERILRGPAGRIDTAGHEFMGRVEQWPENSGLQQFARFAVTISL